MSEAEQEGQGKSLKAGVMEWAENIVVAVIFVAVVFTLAARIITIDGRSMEPTYHNGDRVLVSGFAGEVRQGDVVIVVHALAEPIVKRVVATEGQVVDFDPAAGELTVDGAPLPGEIFGLENGITFLPEYSDDLLDFPQTVPENCVFVLGDNRKNSQDSRFQDVGMIDHRNILGKVVFNLYPFSIMGRPR